VASSPLGRHTTHQAARIPSRMRPARPGRRRAPRRRSRPSWDGSSSVPRDHVCSPEPANLGVRGSNPFGHARQVRSDPETWVTRNVPKTWVTISCRTDCRWSARSSARGRYSRDHSCPARRHCMKLTSQMPSSTSPDAEFLTGEHGRDVDLFPVYRCGRRR
jgi:hypothetical protein